MEWLAMAAVLLLSCCAVLLRRTLHALTFKTSMASDPGAAWAVLEATVPSWGELVKLARPDGTELGMVYVRGQRSTHLIVYSHGNGGALSSGHGSVYYMQERCKLLARPGVDLLCYDYSGYGPSTGPRSEQRWHDDCRMAFKYGEGELGWARDKIIAVGQSIGTGVTIRHLSLEHGYGGVVLFHPLRSIVRTRVGSVAALLLRWFDLFNTDSWIAGMEVPWQSQPCLLYTSPSPRDS
eukprot:TRINITY_DN17655_c0_g1_i2.p1 TRINITY_DN17655_c0_g1~~TRINITY_DN17655_c0_g1_i2.p1  ORF type:complete len:237 (+),score=50.86 TRINITY_DN17655_c0_g1_i2:249-959(+)